MTRLTRGSAASQGPGLFAASGASNIPCSPVFWSRIERPMNYASRVLRLSPDANTAPILYTVIPMGSHEAPNACGTHREFGVTLVLMRIP